MSYKIEKLSHGCRFLLEEPFDLARTLESGQCFRWEKTDAGYRGAAGSHAALLMQHDPLSLELIADDDPAFWAEYLDLDRSYRAVDALAYFMGKYDLNSDGGLWRQMADAYELLCAQYPDKKVQYREEKAECIEKLIELEGPDYELYKAVFSIYFLNGQYDEAERILQHYEASCPEDYNPHAMRGYMLLQMENELWASEEYLRAAKEEFEIADRMIRDTDDRYFYDMLKEAIENDEKIIQALQEEPAYTG